MAISRAQSPNLAAVNRILAEIGKSVDPDSQQGVDVSAPEAEKILDQVGKLNPGARKLVEAEIMQLLVNDVFTATPEARDKFAKHFGVESKDLEPRARAEMIGLTQTTNAFSLSAEAVAQTPKLDRKSMKMLISKADNFLDLNGQQHLAAVLRNASRDGTIKMDGDARKAFRKWMGGLDQDGGVSDWGKTFDKPGVGNVDYLSGLMASGMCFEDLLAAFMIHIAGQMQKEMKDKMEELTRKEDQMRADDKKRQQAKSTRNAQSHLEQAGFNVQNPDGADKAGGEGKTPDAGGTEEPKGPQTPPQGPDLITRTKQNLEAIVQSVDVAKNRPERGGELKGQKVITKEEAGKIADKFRKLEPPVSKLVAKALLDSMRRTPELDQKSDTFAPLVGWIKEQLGDDIPLRSLKAVDTSDPDDPIAKRLRGSNKLEDRIASFVIDTMMTSDKDLKSKMKDVKQLSSDLRDHAESNAAFKEACAKPLDGGKPAPANQPVADATPEKAGDGAPEAQPPAGDAQVSARSAAQPSAPDGGVDVAKAVADGDVAALAHAGAEEAGDAAKPTQNKSRQILMEELKQLQQEFSSVMQAISNVMNAMHQNAMNAVRQIR
jgi:hypothetical protein